MKKYEKKSEKKAQADIIYQPPLLLSTAIGLEKKKKKNNQNKQTHHKPILLDYSVMYCNSINDLSTRRTVAYYWVKCSYVLLLQSTHIYSIVEPYCTTWANDKTRYKWNEIGCRMKWNEMTYGTQTHNRCKEQAGLLSSHKLFFL